MCDVALGVLDLVPIPSGSTAADALRNSADLAQQVERFGYARYWFAEHHLNPGVAGTSPAVLLALTASRSSVCSTHCTRAASIWALAARAAAHRGSRPHPCRRRPRSSTAAPRTAC
ncbi:LLM class flavin-dependent oxidoreductase [Streptomyces sp. NPDC048523]|uniref:LLM class flavin-dependent oxidoreductase n=1 Tax=Streptomyces sp. NPDC048523 TaxID=3365567 RepID=UPI0037161B58